jgi:hypothetical protein
MVGKGLQTAAEIMRMLFARSSDDCVHAWVAAGYFERGLGDDYVPGVVAAGPFLAVGTVAYGCKCWFLWVLLVLEVMVRKWLGLFTGVSVSDIAA